MKDIVPRHGMAQKTKIQESLLQTVFATEIWFSFFFILGQPFAAEENLSPSQVCKEFFRFEGRLASFLVVYVYAGCLW